jgi:hypothetical protein
MSRCRSINLRFAAAEAWTNAVSYMTGVASSQSEEKGNEGVSIMVLIHLEFSAIGPQSLRATEPVGWAKRIPSIAPEQIRSDILPSLRCSCCLITQTRIQVNIVAINATV